MPEHPVPGQGFLGWWSVCVIKLLYKKSSLGTNWISGNLKQYKERGDRGRNVSKMKNFKA